MNMSGNLAPVAVVDDQPINIATMSALIGRLMDLCRRNEGFTVFTLNLDHLVKRRRDARFKAAYSRATLVTADGWPVAAIARRQGVRVDRVTGADLVDPLCEAAAANHVPVFLFGSTVPSLEGAAHSLRKRYPRLDIRGMEAPPMGFNPTSSEAEAMAARIAATGAKLCFVALGAPKQELFADAMAQRFPQLGFLCIGAALDFVSGHQKRAPKLVQKLNVEWFWRMAGDPRRLAVRYGSCALVLGDVLLKLTAGRSM